MRYSHRALYFILIVALLLIEKIDLVAQVISVSPIPQRIDVPRDGALVVEFAAAIDPATVNSNSFLAFGRWSGVMDGSFSFENGNQRIRFQPAREFSAGEYVTVNLSSDIAFADGTPLTHGYTWNFWAKADPGSLELQEIARIPVRQPGEVHIQTYGAFAGDLNEDGYSDYSVPNELANDVRVFLNDGQGGYSSFTAFPLPGGSVPSTNEGADFNRDGHIDFVVGNIGNSLATVYLGDGNGGFLSITSYTAGQSIRGITVLDAEGDGDIDIVSANYSANNLALLLNNGSGVFGSAQSFESGGNGERAVAAADVNEDGIGDLIVGVFNSNELLMLLGDGSGGYALSDRISVGGSPWMLAIGDINGDGTLDVASANSSNNSASAAFTDGQGNFINAVSYSSGGTFPLAIDLGDLDGDGDLDLLVSNFGNFGSNNGRWRCYENDGDGNFINPADYPASKAASCAVFHDRDRDGDLDLTCIDELDDLLFIFEPLPLSLPYPGGPPSGFALGQNYPNPFNPLTNFGFRISDFGFVKLEIFDLSGRKIRTLRSEPMVPGTYETQWDGRDDVGALMASGVYLYRLQAGALSQVRKMVLVR